MMFSKCLLIVALSALMATAVICDGYGDYDSGASEYGYRQPYRSYPNNVPYPSNDPYQSSGPYQRSGPYNGPQQPPYNDRPSPYQRPSRYGYTPFKQYRQYEESKDDYKKDECNDLTKCCPEGEPIIEVKEKTGSCPLIWEEYGDNVLLTDTDEPSLSPFLRAKFLDNSDCARLTCDCGYQLRIDALYCGMGQGNLYGDDDSCSTAYDDLYNIVGGAFTAFDDIYLEGFLKTIMFPLGEVLMCCVGNNWNLAVTWLTNGVPLDLHEDNNVPEGSYTRFRASCQKIPVIL